MMEERENTYDMIRKCWKGKAETKWDSGKSFELMFTCSLRRSGVDVEVSNKRVLCHEERQFKAEKTEELDVRNKDSWSCQFLTIHISLPETF